MSDFDIGDDVPPEQVPDPEEPIIDDVDEEAVLDGIETDDDDLATEEGIEFDVKDVVDDTRYGDDDDQTYASPV
jgi:hypothetical protein